jgi:hypothetical protein
MTLCHVAGGHGLQMWRVVANILNKQSWIVDGLGLGLTTLHQKQKFLEELISYFAFTTY